MTYYEIIITEFCRKENFNFFIILKESLAILIPTLSTTTLFKLKKIVFILEFNLNIVPGNISGTSCKCSNSNLKYISICLTSSYYSGLLSIIFVFMMNNYQLLTTEFFIITLTVSFLLIMLF